MHPQRASPQPRIQSRRKIDEPRRHRRHLRQQHTQLRDRIGYTRRLRQHLPSRGHHRRRRLHLHRPSPYRRNRRKWSRHLARSMSSHPTCRPAVQRLPTALAFRLREHPAARRTQPVHAHSVAAPSPASVTASPDGKRYPKLLRCSRARPFAAAGWGRCPFWSDPPIPRVRFGASRGRCVRFGGGGWSFPGVEEPAFGVCGRGMGGDPCVAGAAEGGEVVFVEDASAACA